jgi:hypothetical protein
MALAFFHPMMAVHISFLLNIIYFPLPGLRDYIVISPSYVIDAFKSIVTDKMFCRGMRHKSVQSMNQDGILETMMAVHISFLLLHSEVPLFQDLPDSLH